MVTYRLMDGLSGRPGNGPASVTSFSGNLVVGCVFGVNQGGLWISGYYWWVPPGGDTSSGQKFALWQVNGASGGVLVPNSTITAGALTANTWNLITLAAPLLLTPYGAGSALTYGAVYCAATGRVFVNGFPETKNQFGSGQPFAAGITNGPLFAFSSTGGSAPAGGSSGWSPQEPFTTGTADPSAAMPSLNDSDANLWLDVQVTDAPPASPAYRGFPNSPRFVVPGAGGQQLAYTLGLQFTVSQSCTLQKIWHYSPSDATVLPTRCALWNVAGQTVVAGTDNTSPSWKKPDGTAASAGAGWIYVDYSGSGVTLSSGVNYKASTFTSDNTHVWFLAQANIWGSSPQPFPSGITQGPLSILGNAASSPGQDSWNQGITWTYPATSTNPEFDGIDVEIAPVAGPPFAVARSTPAVTAAVTSSPSATDPRDGTATVIAAVTSSPAVT